MGTNNLLVGTVERIVKNAMQNKDFQFRLVPQMNDKEPSPEEVEQSLSSLLLRSPSIFLERYGGFLGVNDLKEFENCNGWKDEYEVKWYLNELNKKLRISQPTPNPKKKTPESVIVRNRRFNYMQCGINNKIEYFTEENCKTRQPYLYQLYIGRYHKKKGKERPYNDETPLSERVLINIDIDRTEERRIKQEEDASKNKRQTKETQKLKLVTNEALEKIKKKLEDSKITKPVKKKPTKTTEDSEEESEWESESEEDEIESKKEVIKKIWNEIQIQTQMSDSDSESGVDDFDSDDDGDESESDIFDSEGEKMSYEDMKDSKDQFMNLVYQKFLDGEDSEFFDYSTIDNDDSLDVGRDADIESKYFEGEEDEDKDVRL